MREGKQVALFGAGSYGLLLLKFIKRWPLRIIGFFDNDLNKEGTFLEGYPVFLPTYIEKLKPDIIIITSFTHQNEIYDKIKDYERFGIEIIKVYELEGVSDI
jgi:FlaA1/EpsC-like NDP-sugar epimerase